MEKMCKTVASQVSLLRKNISIHCAMNRFYWHLSICTSYVHRIYSVLSMPYFFPSLSLKKKISFFAMLLLQNKTVSLSRKFANFCKFFICYCKLVNTETKNIKFLAKTKSLPLHFVHPGRSQINKHT